MSATSTFLAEKLLAFLDGTAWTPPAGVEVGLFVTPLNADDLGTEVSGGGYTRKTVSFAPAADGSISSFDAITWTPLDSATTRTIFGWGIYDDTTGDLLFYGRFTTPFTVAANRTLTLAAGAITISRPSGEGLTASFATSWLDKVLRAQSFTAPAALYLGMFTEAPDGDGVGGTEVTGGSYARQAHSLTVASTVGTFGAADFTPLDSGEANAVVAHGWWDASSGGNLIAWRYTYDDTTLDVDVAAGDTLDVADTVLRIKPR